MHKLPKNPINSNKYIYLSGFNGNISIQKQIWNFDFNIYLNHNFYLPINLIDANFIFPFCNVDKLTLTLTKTKEFPSYIIDTETCNLYKATFSVDTSSNKYFDNKFINFLMKFTINFKFSEEVINSANLDNNPNEIIEFISDGDNMQWSHTLNLQITEKMIMIIE